jgi:hypothetical protein
MATKEQSTDPLARSIYAPVVLEERQKEIQQLRDQQAKNRAKTMKCLDPLVAATYEAKKPTYEWEIKVDIFRPAGKKSRARTEKITDQVVAQDANTAWAIFCDKIGEWPSPLNSNATITPLKQRTADIDD